MSKFLTIFFFLFINSIYCQVEKEITGTPISSDTKTESVLLNSAFDDDFSTEFISNLTSNCWIGLKLETPHQITKIGWGLNEYSDKSDYLFGIFEGANDPSFFDAIPLFMITEEEKIGKMNYENIKINYSFKYLRYVGPFNKKCKISEIKFYGYEAKKNKNLRGNSEFLYQPTNTPLIVIHTENSIDPTKENEINCNILIIDENKEDTKSKGKIKIRGNSTAKLIKKPYQIEFESKEKILDLPAKAQRWRLIANYADKTLLRNSIGLKISSLLEMEYTPACTFVDVMLNGEYKGNYNLCDVIEVGKKRIDISEMDETCNEEPEISGGYHLEISGYALDEPIHSNTTRGIFYKFIYPTQEDITSEQIEYIENKINNVENEVYSGIFDNIDLESFIKYMIIQEVAVNIDAMWSINIIKKRQDDNIYFGPVWDFDIAFGNDERLYPVENLTDFIFKYGSSAGSMRRFTMMIFSNKKFLKYFKEKWNEDIKNKISKKVLFDFIDEKIELMKDSIKLNFLRWDVLIRKVKRNPVVKCTYEGEIEYLKDFIEKRLGQLDEIIMNANENNIYERITLNPPRGQSIYPIGIIEDYCLDNINNDDIKNFLY